MYPYDILFEGFDLYILFITLGIISALVVFRVLADKNKFPAGLQNLVLIGAVFAIVIGYGSAVLFQGIYNAIDTGKFTLGEGTGATFYGGLIGGAVVILLVYFLGGKFILKNDDNKKHFMMFLQIALCAVAIAHGFGRLGCLMAGCCHGHETDSWIGIKQYIELSNGSMGWAKVVPTQLFEALFLFAIGAIMFYLAWKGKKVNFAIYTIGYGIWRIIIEEFRADDRGETIVKFLTPSQLIAVLLILLGIAYIAFLIIYNKKKTAIDNQTKSSNEDKSVKNEKINDNPQE